MKQGSVSKKCTFVILSALGIVVLPACRRAYPPPPASAPIKHTTKTGKKIEAREVIDFNRDWRFALGKAINENEVSFDKAAWQKVHLPHDWAIAGPFDANESGYAGKLPWKGVGRYRKTFRLDADDKNGRVYFDFDGVMAFPQVYVNGKLAGSWDYGYMSFRVDATPHVRFDGTNILTVHVDTRQHGTRWYPGAGIYRKVTMTICNPIHLGHWATSVTTPEINEHQATIQIDTRIDNHTDTHYPVTVDVTIVDPDEHSVAAFTSKEVEMVPADAQTKVSLRLTIEDPQRWDIRSPKRYTLKTVLRVEDEVVDRETIPFGIRTFQFTANDGFHLNGRRVQLYGVNLHHDHGPLGAAFYPRAMERQLEIMQDMGCNAIRTSHNPPAPELLEFCDRMGLVVWNECFDKWGVHADRIEDEPMQAFGEKQIRNLVMRDRNHPSVVTWSIGNEIAWLESDKHGDSAEQIAFMSEFVRKYDPTRPVTLGCFVPKAIKKNVLDPLDITGWNYGRRYAPARAHYPDKPIIYSESASTLSTRGFYELPLPTTKTDYSDQLQVDSYDRNAARWSDIPDKEFQLMETDGFVAGEFVWTGFDYLGEPTPFTKEARSSYFGIVDLCGIPKDRYYLYRSLWRPEKNTVHILPHWNWPERVGQPVPVYVYTNGDSAELFLNGTSLGRRHKELDPPDANDYYAITDKYRLRWDEVIYEPGELKVVAYKNDTPIGEAVQHTASDPTQLRLTPDRKILAASGTDLSYILIEALDKDGTPCPLADNLIRFKIKGPAEIAGVGNGNPLSLEPFQAKAHKLFYGKAMLILRTQKNQTGIVNVAAMSDRLAGATVIIRCR